MSKRASDDKTDSGDGSVPIPVPLATLLDVAGRFVAVASLLTAVLFYFGYVRTNALFLYFGIDQSALKFGTEDYLLRSIRGMAEPLRWILVAVFVIAWAHYAIARWLGRSSDLAARRRARLVRLAGVAGVVAILVNLIATWYAAQRPMQPLFYPLTWTVGICLIGYAIYLSEPATHNGKEAGVVPYAPVRRTSLWVFAGLLLQSLVWGVAVYAESDGLYRARQIAYYLESQPSVVVYSQADLHIQMTGVTLDRYCPTPDTCWNRYSGLKFLVRSNDRYFLLPVDWDLTQGRTLVLSESEAIRIEFAPGDVPQLPP